MEPRCPECGTATADGAKFCADCGARLSTGLEDAGDVRKTITVLFCDLVGSSSLAEGTDPEVLRVILDRYFETVQGALERHGGTVEKFIGDAVVARFGVPVAREDDALRAVRAAFDMRAALDRLNPELEERWGVSLAVRIGVNTGEVYIGASSDHAVGDAVNVAARLEQAAAPGEVLVGETTWQLVRARAQGERVASLELKGRDRPVPAWRVDHVAAVADTSAADAGAGTPSTPLVGRRRELALLREVFDRAVADRTCQLVTIFGAAGVGKTRVATEFVSSLGATAGAGPASSPRSGGGAGSAERPGLAVRVLAGRCLPYGDGTSMWPLAETLRSAARGVDPQKSDAGQADTADTAGPTTGATNPAVTALRAALEGRPDATQIADYLAPLLGAAGTAASADELKWAVRRWIEALADSGPLVWVLEDMHWAKPAFVSIVDDVADWSRDVPVVMLCMARPEFLDDHPTWGGGKLNSLAALLRPLTPGESSRLVASLTAEVDLPDGAVAQLVESSGGTPLFLEQYIALMANAPAAAAPAAGRRVPGDVRAVPVPATIGALLTARLEQLQPEERRVLEGAAVAEQTFYPGAIAYVTGLHDEVVEEALRSLLRKDLVRTAAADLPGEEAYRISHVLVADTAYQALPKLVRARLHERYAVWLEKRADDLPGESDDLVGHHLAVAASLLHEIGDVDGRAAQVAKAAVEHLRHVASRLSATDARAAALVYARAAELVAGTADSVDLSLRRGVMLFRDGQYAAARELLDVVHADAEQTGDRSLALRARLAWIDAASHAGEPVPITEIDETVSEALEHFTATQDEEGLATAYATRITRFTLVANWSEVMEAAGAVMSHGRALGSPYFVQYGRHFLYASLGYGPTPVGEGLERLRADAGTAAPGPNDRGLRLATEGVLLGFAADAAGSRAAFTEARRIFSDTHYRLGLVNTDSLAAIAERALGDMQRCEEHLVRLDAALAKEGERSFRSTSTGLLARLRCEQGDFAEGRRLVELSAELGQEGDVATDALVRAVRAMVRAADGAVDEACRLADESVEVMENSDMIAFVADMYDTRAHVYRLAGREDEARRSWEEALSRYRAKGDRADAARVARTLVGEG